MANNCIRHAVLLSMVVALSTAVSVPKTHEDDDDDTLKLGTKDLGVVEAVCARIRDSSVFDDDHDFLRRLAYVESFYGKHEDTYRNKYYGGIWQVDESMLTITQDPTAQRFLSNVIGEIQTQLGIDWSSVQWPDLARPLYSALAARLFIEYQSRDSPDGIPESVVDQAEFWATYYRPDMDKKYFIAEINQLEGGIGLKSKEEAESIQEKILEDSADGDSFAERKRQVVLPHRAIGCYQDCGMLGLNSFDRDLPVINIWLSGLTRDACYSFCTTHGYRYAGLQFGNTCCCGHSYGRFKPLPPSSCALGCNGRLLEQCGGFCTNYILGPP